MNASAQTQRATEGLPAGLLRPVSWRGPALWGGYAREQTKLAPGIERHTSRKMLGQSLRVKGRQGPLWGIISEKI